MYDVFRSIMSVLTITNGVDLDEMQQYAAFYLDLYCQSTLLRVYMIKRLKALLNIRLSHGQMHFLYQQLVMCSYDTDNNVLKHYLFFR